jgi:tetratricopeptide (TPR) repeat protein
LRYGGVCGDQTYFAARVAKSQCVPALGATGENRFGGRHAWVGYLTTGRRKAMLVFSGRYLTDYYYTGRVMDPQTGFQVLERHVAMMFDGMSVSYPSYERSRALIQLAQRTKSAEPAQSLALVQRALSVNPFLPDGWRLLMEHFTAGRVERAEALTWFNHMLEALKPHPDMTFECLGDFIDCYAGDDLDQRTEMYRRALAIYNGRPDLQMALCTKLADEMIAADKKQEALMFLLRPILRNAKEGSVILPAVATAVRLAFELDVAEQALAELTKALQQFPRRRRGSRENSEAYEAFESLLEGLEGS